MNLITPSTMRNDMQITLWPMIFLQLCSMFKSRVYGFQTNVFALKRSASKIHSLATHDNDLVPTVKNPISKRKIHVGGPKFNDFIKQGMWVQHQGTLQKLDLRALSDYQQGILTETTRTIQATLEQTNQEFNTEDWHCITPTLAQQSTTLTSPLGENELSVLKRQLLFVNKPSGFHCVPSRDLSDSLSTQIASIYPAARPCHRLDRDTSGIVIFGLSADPHREISKQFEARTTSKTYMALIAGHPKEEYGRINKPIGKEKTKEGFHRWTIGGEKPRQAITEWRVDTLFTDADTGAKFSRVELKPLTGRGHQLRLHMKALGCPILGDTIHGEGGVATCSPRLCLHAQKLQVDWNGMRLKAESVTPF